MLTSRAYGGARGDVRAAELDAPVVGRSKPAIRRSVVVLPEPDGPSIVKNSPARDLEVDAVDRDDVAVGLAQCRRAARRERRPVRASSGRSSRSLLH